MERFSKWDAADYMETPADVAAHLNVALEDGDPGLVTYMLGAAARSKGMTEVARRTGLNRVSLYKALGEGGNPSFFTVLKVLEACGVAMHFEPAGRDALAGA